MKTYKTDIKCGGCLAKVAPYLNETFGQGNWKVDTSSQEKLLTVDIQEELDDEAVKRTVAKAGFFAEPIAA